MDTNIRSDILAEPASAQAFSFRWSLLLGVEGPRVPVALSPGGVEWSAAVCDLSTALPFVMVVSG